MFVIVEIAGQQFKVEKGKSYCVHRLHRAVDENVSFDKVLLLHNESDIRVGTPLLEDISVDAKVLEHLKGDKVVVFKKKRRKGYRVKTGHRQCFTKILVEDIVLDGDAPRKKATKKETVVEQPADTVLKQESSVETVMEVPVIENTVVETIEKAAPKKRAPKKAETVVEESAIDSVAPKKKAPKKAETAVEESAIDGVAPKKRAPKKATTAAKEDKAE
jgi:large subunit ribosomal protein L21